MGKIRPINSYVDFIEAKPREVEEKIKKLFSKGAYVYEVLDNEVVLGLYKAEEYRFRLYDGNILRKLSWEYVKELAVFDPEGELRVRRRQDGFVGRYRKDKEERDDKSLYKLDEVLKLWGVISDKEEQGEGSFCLLTSQRGSRIWIPPIASLEQEGKKEAGIQVRTYYRFAKDTENSGLLYQEDERFMGLCPWPQEGGGRNE